MNIGKAIKTVRQTKYPELSQQSFAKCVGITQTYLSQIESGNKNASTETLSKIADFCEIPLPIMFWYSVEKNDVPEHKKQAFDIIKNPVDELLNTLIYTKQ